MAKPKSWTAWVWFYHRDGTIDKYGRRHIQWYPIVTVHPEVSDRKHTVYAALVSIYPWAIEQRDRVWIGPEGHRPVRKTE